MGLTLKCNPEFISGSRNKFGIAFFLFSIFYFLFSPHQALAATINLSPGSGSFGLGSTFSVAVRVNTQNDSVNTAEASISYSTNTLELVSVRSGSTFYLASPGSPSKGSGSAYFGGGLPTPGYNGSGGALGSMTFRAKALGNATVSVTAGKVLLNDGLGTDAYNGGGTARFTITPPPVSSVTVSSTTHPSAESWYAKPKLDLSWDRPDGAYGYSFEFDQEPDTVPDSTLDTTITTTKSYADLKDGVWYFHIRARAQSASAGFGPTTHFKIQVDTQKPLLFDITMVGQSDLNDVTRTPTITFEAKDETSGIDHYDVYMDSELIQAKAESPYTFDKLDGGPHVIRVVAFDKAGNERKAELPIIAATSAGFLMKTLTLPIYILLIVNLLILILLSLILWMVFKRKRKPNTASDQVAEIQAEIYDSLEDLKKWISAKLLTLASKSNKEIYNNEENVAKAVVSSVSKTRRKLDKKMGKLSKTVRK